jgi:hypothetical protein
LLPTACNLNLLAFESFLIIFATVFGVCIVLSLIAATFNTQRIARVHLILNTTHACAGFVLSVGPLVRNDMNSFANPGFWWCFAIWIGGVLAHSLLMTETVKRLSLSVAPSYLSSDGMMDQFAHSGRAQRVAMWFAGLQCIFMVVCFCRVGYTKSPADDPSVLGYWNMDPNYVDRREFWFFVGCMTALTSSLTFILIPLVLHQRLFAYVRETRIRAEELLATSPTTGAGGRQKSARSSLVVVNQPPLPSAPVADDFPVKKESTLFDEENRGSKRFSRDSRDSKDEEAENEEGGRPVSTRSRRPSRIEQVTRSLSKVGEMALENLADTLTLPAPKKKATASEMQRKQMKDFESKMLQSFISGLVGMCLCVVLFSLVCDSRVVGPRCFLMFPILGLGWFLQFSVLNLYFPESTLHRHFVSRLPKWVRDQIDGVEF